MVEISNVKVYDLQESVCACRNAMRIEPSDYSAEDFEKSLKEALDKEKGPLIKQ